MYITTPSMVLILDGNSEIGEHVYNDIDSLHKNLLRQQSKIKIFF